VQEAWRNGQELRIHGLIYNLHDGLLKNLGLTLNKLEDLPKEFRTIE
jgi:carbonic anhydrase